MAIDEIQLNFNPSSLWLLNGILALIMFGVSLDLKASDFKQLAVSPRGPLIGLFAQFLLLPGLTFLLTRMLKPEPSIALGMILIASCPGGNLSNFITYLSKGNTALSVCMTAISTAAAIIMTPLNLSFWGNMHPDTAALITQVSLDPVDVLLTVGLILGIPLVCGILFARQFPGLAERMKKPFKWASVLFFLIFVGVVFSQNYANFLQAIGAIVLAVFLHNALALSTGYGMATAVGCPERDRRAVAIEVGIQNSALGLTLIFNFFGGLGGMALIAGWWGIWHIISGMSLATYWSRYTPEGYDPE